MLEKYLAIDLFQVNRYVSIAAAFHLGVERGREGGSLRTKKWSWNYDNRVNFCTPGLHSHLVQ